MSNAFDRAARQIVSIGQKTDAAIEGAAGSKLKFILIVWDDKLTSLKWDFTYTSNIEPGALGPVLHRVSRSFLERPKEKPMQ